MSILGTVSAVKTLAANCFHRQFLTDEDYKEQVQNSIKNNCTREYRDSHYNWQNFNDQYYLYSDKVDSALSENADKLLLKVSPKMQKATSEQQQAIVKIVTDKVAQGINIFNSNLVRLRTDLLLDTVLNDQKNLQNICQVDDSTQGIRFKDVPFIEIDKTSYFYNLTTNDLIYSRFFKSDFSSIYCGKDMTADKDDKLYNLSQSPAANIIGVSTLAITKDGYFVINKQNNSNDVNNNSYAPSGSGSSDFADLTECRKLKSDDVLTKLQNELNDIVKNYNKIDLPKTAEKVISFKDKDISEFNREVAEYKYKSELLKDKKAIEHYLKRMRKYTCSFSSFIKFGMVRELMEESHVCTNEDKKYRIETVKNCMKNTKIYGFIRILDRGGKPDFFGVTFLQDDKNTVEQAFNKGRINVTQTELKKGCSITDFNEVCKQIYIRADDVFRCKDSDDFLKLIRKVDTGEGVKNTTTLSLQLHCLFNLVKKNETEIKNFIQQTPTATRGN
ncbi:MAG: hypothetical protein ACI4MQ_02760 [Candidatus Coproplasma sp.]